MSEAAQATGQIFGYHLQQAVVKINEARRQLGLPPVERGDLTVPEFLKELGVSQPGASNASAADEKPEEGPESEEAP